MAPEDAESYANSLNALTNQARGVVRDLNPHVTTNPFSINFLLKLLF